MKKHILHSKSNRYQSIFWAFHHEEFIQAPKNKNYQIGDVLILSPNIIKSGIIITSKEEIIITYPKINEIREDVIGLEITGIKKCYLHNKCRTGASKKEFIQKHYPKIFNHIFGEKLFIEGEKGFRYGFKTFNGNALNPKCTWTQIESNVANYTTECGHSFKEIGDYAFCPHCSGKIEDKPLFHIVVTDRYTELLQEIKDNLNRIGDDIHRFTDTLVFIEKMVKDYSSILGFKKEEILEAFEKQRRIWAANYYQEAKFPKIHGEVNVFISKKDLRETVDFSKGFRCGICEKITLDNDKECGQCGHKTFGFLSSGKEYKIIIRDEFLISPIVHKIMMPVALEVK